MSKEVFAPVAPMLQQSRYMEVQFKFTAARAPTYSYRFVLPVYRSTIDSSATFFYAIVGVLRLFQPRQQENDRHLLLLAPG